MKYCYEYPRPAVTVDTVVFKYQNDTLSVLFVKRGSPPFKGFWALPGGFVEMDESLENAAKRELCEETGVKVTYLDQLYAFGDVGRDTRQRVISITYFALVRSNSCPIQAGSDAADAAWFPIHHMPPLAFDHAQMVQMAIKRLRESLMQKRIGFELLPHEFTLGQLQKLYETILDQSLDKRNFRKKVIASGALVALPKKLRSVPHRSPTLYSFGVPRNL